MPSPAAKRMARKRARDRDGLIVIRPMAVPRDLQHKLVMLDLIEPQEIADAEALRLAMERLAHAIADEDAEIVWHV